MRWCFFFASNLSSPEQSHADSLLSNEEQEVGARAGGLGGGGGVGGQKVGL